MPKNIILDGNPSDWEGSEKIDRGDSISAHAHGGTFYFAIHRGRRQHHGNAVTGYQVFGFGGGAEFNLNITSDCTSAQYR